MTYPKRMQSKDGGFTHVYSVGEEDQLRAHGWVPEEVKPVETITVKRGRPAKHVEPVETNGADNVQ